MIRVTVLHRIALVLLGMLLSLGPVAAKPIQIFVLTGQSNSLGVTNGGEVDISIGSDPADAHVKFWWSNVADATTPLGDSGGVFTTLREQQGGHYPGSATHWGPEISFARGLYRAGVRNFAVIKASRGGGGNGQWSKEENGHMYRLVVDTVNAATAALRSKGQDCEIVALLYVQGESDNPYEAAQSGARFRKLLDHMRADLDGADNLQGVIGGIASATAKDDIVRARQRGEANKHPDIHYFCNVDQRKRLHDGLHFNKAAKLSVGSRFAQVVLDAGMVKRHYGRLAFIGDSITQGGNDHPSYRYHVFEEIASKGVPNRANAGYEFIGSQTEGYQGLSGDTPAVNGHHFVNRHEGHWGWRASWMSGRVALPAGRYQRNNLGCGVLRNWTGQAGEYETADSGILKYQGPTYAPDTVVMKIGINDLADGAAPSRIRDDLGLMVDQLRACKPDVCIHLCQVLYSNRVNHQLVDQLNGLLPELVARKNRASGQSPVWLIKVNEGFDPAKMTYDKTHPNAIGERHVGERIAAGLGIISEP